MLRVLKRWFDSDFLSDPTLKPLLTNCSAVVALYPDEGTDFILRFTASVAPSLRSCLIPCDDCRQFWPVDDPTYEGFVAHLLREDKRNLLAHGHTDKDSHGLPTDEHPLAMVRDRVDGAPYCQVLLQRTPPRSTQQEPTAASSLSSMSSLTSPAAARDAARRERLAMTGARTNGAADTHGRSCCGCQSGADTPGGGACGYF